MSRFLHVQYKTASSVQMLDTHAQTMDQVEQHVDVMTDYKMTEYYNTLHVRTLVLQKGA